MRRPSQHNVTGLVMVGVSAVVLAAMVYGLIFGLGQGLRGVPW